MSKKPLKLVYGDKVVAEVPAIHLKDVAVHFIFRNGKTATYGASDLCIADTRSLISLIDRSRYYSMSEVGHILGCHRTTVWRMIARGDLPRPIKLTEKATVMPGDRLADSLSALQHLAEQGD